MKHHAHVTDLPKRLREAAEWDRLRADYSREGELFDMTKLLLEAADEIEKLNKVDRHHVATCYVDNCPKCTAMLGEGAIPAIEKGCEA